MGNLRILPMSVAYSRLRRAGEQQSPERSSRELLRPTGRSCGAARSSLVWSPPQIAGILGRGCHQIGGTMRRRPCLFLSLALATFAAIAHAPAEAPPAKLKTQKVTFKLVREAPFMKGLDRAIELVQIPADTIVMTGPDGKDHHHAIKPIWVAKYETRWDEYDPFWRMLDMTEEQSRTVGDSIRGSFSKRESGRWERPESPYVPPDAGFGIAGYPASCIHFQAAVKYCTWLSKLTGKKFRLPTEAEWEYACRAGGPPVKPDAEALADVAWFAGNSQERPHEVGKKRPNAWGLYDMLGNVGEYVICDPTDTAGVIAGGTWSDQAKDVHSGAREPYSPEWQKTDPFDPKGTSWFDYDRRRIGLRVVMED
jgi:formylglycine-generating enzyme required for sulfatase activity